MTAAVDQLPVRERQHRWPIETEKRLHGSEFPDGNDRTERSCPLCGMARVTVHGAGDHSAWREWRTKDGSVWVGTATPPCLGEAS
jgi:hypothetical protein